MAVHLFFLVMVTKFADVGGYILGKITANTKRGNHKITPRISPKKSWEGLIGSILLSSSVALILYYSFTDSLTVNGIKTMSVMDSLILAFVLSIIGLIGDLTVSVLKRAAKAKDAGSLIPGFGGVLDLVDSLIIATPCYYCMLILIN